MRTPEEPTVRVERLRQSLTAVAEAVAAASLPDLLAAESELAASLASVNAITDVPAAHRPRLLVEIRRAQVALSRCNSLGFAVNAVTEATLVAHGDQHQYDRGGFREQPIASQSSMDVRA